MYEGRITYGIFIGSISDWPDIFHHANAQGKRPFQEGEWCPVYVCVCVWHENTLLFYSFYRKQLLRLPRLNERIPENDLHDTSV